MWVLLIFLSKANATGITLPFFEASTKKHYSEWSLIARQRMEINNKSFSLSSVSFK